MKKKSDKSLTNQLDKVFRQAMRVKKPRTNCFVCHREADYFAPKTNPYGLQVGHFISRSVYPLRWDFDNCDFVCLTAGHNISMFDGDIKKIEQLSIGDRLTGFPENTNSENIVFQESIVLDIKEYQPDELFLVEVDESNSIRCTKDHQLLCFYKNKVIWLNPVEISNILHIGDMCDILSI